MGITHSRRASRAVSGATALVIGAAGIVAASAPALATSVTDPRVDTVYTSMPADAPASHPSIGFTATSTRELGDRINLGGEARVLQQLTVGLNSWACETGGWNSDCATTPGSSFEHPITVHFYEVGANGAVGSELASVEQTFAIPFRPAPDEDNCGTGTTQWYDAARDSCQNGMTVPVTFDVTGMGIALPQDVIVSFTYPTSRFDELTETGPYDSLNIDLVPDAPTVGTDVDPDELYVDSTWANMYEAGDEVGTFHATGDWTGYALNMAITAVPATDIVAVAPFVGSFEGDELPLSNVQRGSSQAMLAAAGCGYGLAPVTNYGTHGSEGFVFTRYSGYATLFPEAGYTASADFYLDAEAAEGQFTWSHAINGTDATHQRDWVFAAGADGAGAWTVGAGNNVNTSGPTGYGDTPLAITDSGWYTFQHHFYGVDGLLYADLSVLDAHGTVLSTWTLGGNAKDRVPATVGGNRYGWLVTNTYANLPVDNVLLNSERPYGADLRPMTFSDVPGKASNYCAIEWMAKKGIADGFADGTYRPTTPVNRAQMARFIYRLSGEPEFLVPGTSPFSDVSKSAGNYTAIAWLEGTGLADGFGDGTYRPLSSTNRAQMARFMYRLAGEPDVVLPEVSPFIDVDESASNYVAIVWMSQTGIADGYGDGTYRPTVAVNRGQMARFIERFSMLDS